MLDSIVWVFLTFIMRRVLVPRARVHTHRTPAEGAPSLFCHGGVRTPPFFPPLPALFWTQVTTTSWGELWVCPRGSQKKASVARTPLAEFWRGWPKDSSRKA